MTTRESIAPYDTLAKVSGALAVLNVALGRLLANREDAEEILDELSSVTEMFENLADAARARGSMNEQAILLEMAEGARHTGSEIGSETGGAEAED